MEQNKHYHTIPADEWQNIWLPLQQENEALKKELENRVIGVRLNRRHYGGSFFDDSVKVGWYEINVDLPQGLHIDKDLVKKILFEHEKGDPYEYIYSTEAAKKLYTERRALIAENESRLEEIKKRQRRDFIVAFIMLAMLILNVVGFILHLA